MANKAISTLAVGSSVHLNVGGVRTEFLVVHQGKPSSIYDDSCNGTWLLMKDIYENRVWQSGNINKYESSDIHTYLNGTFLNLFDSNIKDAIKQVKIPYRKNGGSYGIRPALVLSSNVLVDDGGNVVIPDLTAHKTLINGTVYEVKGGKCMVNGTAYDIKKGRTLIGGTGYDLTFAPSYDPVFANNTWEQIIEACHNNEVPETWKVTDQKSMTIGGEDYLIDIIGKNHDDYADGSGKAPLTFQLHDCYKLKKAMQKTTTNSKGWSRCDMRETDLPIILKQMPTEVQSGIREVNKLTSESYTIVTTADKLFLLSEIEIFGSDENSGKGEGTQYDYYKAGNSKVKNYIDSAIEWWERSPYNGNNRFYCCVNYKGASISRVANAVSGVPFAFCF